jgi:hypothetical protein
MRKINRRSFLAGLVASMTTYGCRRTDKKEVSDVSNQQTSPDTTIENQVEHPSCGYQFTYNPEHASEKDPILRQFYDKDQKNFDGMVRRHAHIHSVVEDKPINEIYKMIDTNKDKTITGKEFLDFCEKQSA